MLQNDYLLAKIGVDTAENEPSKFELPACLAPYAFNYVWALFLGALANSIRSNTTN